MNPFAYILKSIPGSFLLTSDKIIKLGDLHYKNCKSYKHICEEIQARLYKAECIYILVLRWIKYDTIEMVPITVPPNIGKLY